MFPRRRYPHLPESLRDDPSRLHKMAYTDWDTETGQNLADLAFSEDGLCWEMS